MTIEIDVAVERPRFPLRFELRTDAPVVGIFGPSGAGKTSLLHAVAGLLKPTSGVIALDPVTLFDAARGIDVPVHRRRVGLAFQDDRLFPHLRVAANLRYGRNRRGETSPTIAVDDVVDLLHLRGLLARRVRNLSGGERQRVAIGRALLSSPRVLLLDEPLSSLDHGHKQQILDGIVRVRDASCIPILYVSHDLTEILHLTDHVLVVTAGRSVALGRIRELARHPEAWRTLRDLGPANLIDTEVVAHDERAGLTTLRLPSPRERDAPPTALLAPPTDLAAGASVRVSIRPEDIALARGVVAGISIRNQLPGRITEITRHPDRALVEVDVGPILLVEVSRQTVEHMTLTKDDRVWCLIKSNAVRYVGATHAVAPSS